MIQRNHPNANYRPLQDEVLRFIVEYKANPDNDGNSPTYRAIAKGLGKNLRTIYVACQKLEQAGAIEINSRGKIVLTGGRYTPPDEDSTS